MVRADNRSVGNGVVACGAEGRCSVRPKNPHMTLCERVPVNTLDQVLTRQLRGGGGVRVAAFKMDVEGYECRVLQGAKTLLPTYRVPVLQIEANRKHVRSCVRRLASEHGYTVQPVPSGLDGKDTNFVAWRRYGGGHRAPSGHSKKKHGR